jgi:hypothetical protein
MVDLFGDLLTGIFSQVENNAERPPLLAAFVIAVARSASAACNALVAGDGLFDVLNDFGLDCGSGFDFSEGDEAGLLLFA